jgi:DNA-binding LytR/AlgR family response regulator
LAAPPTTSAVPRPLARRPAIVNLDRIQAIQPWFQGGYVVILQDRTRLTATRGYRERLQSLPGK